MKELQGSNIKYGHATEEKNRYTLVDGHKYIREDFG